MAHAAKHGADMIEFDVQLSKDQIPVIYHDFYVYTAMMKKLGKEQGGNGASEGPYDMLHLPVKELTLAQLQKLKIYHVKETTRVPKLNDDDFDDHQPFPTLQHALEHLDPHVGFNVEIKWTMQLKVSIDCFKAKSRTFRQVILCIFFFRTDPLSSTTRSNLICI